jgi:hypothetical protein
LTDADAIYMNLPPMRPEAGNAPESLPPAADDGDADDFDDAVDFSSPPPSPPVAGANREPEAASDAPESDEGSDDAEGEDEFDDRDWLIERARKADEYETYLQRIREGAEEQRTTREFDHRLAALNAEFAGRENDIYAQAEQSLNPVAYVREEMRKLSAEADRRFAAYEAEREQALSRYEMARAIPQIAARIVQHYKLPDEAINEILDYPPEYMEREAQKLRARLIRERKAQQEIDQLKRSAARRKTAATPLTTGGGRGASGDGALAAGSDEHYAAIPWSRGRVR